MKANIKHRILIPLILLLNLAACNKSAVTPTPAELTTLDVVIDAATKTAWSGGYITNAGSTITSYGLCWSATNPEPTIVDSKTSETLKYLTFASNITGLTPGMLYYARAYATNDSGTSYGNVITFTIEEHSPVVATEVTTFAGNGSAGFTNGLAMSAAFYHPMGVATDATDNVYVADAFNSAIRKIDIGGQVSTLAGTGNIGFLNGMAATAQFYSTSGVVADTEGNLYVADRGNNMIRKISFAGVVTTLAGSGSVGYNDGTGNDATFNTPVGLAMDGAGNIYVADSGNSLVRKVTPGGVVTTIAGMKATGYSNGVGTESYLNKPTGIAIDASGNIYVAEGANHAIRKIDKDGMLTTIVGGPDNTALLGNPVSLAFDKDDNLYIADANGRILGLAKNNVLAIIAGTSGTTGFVDGNGAAALFNNPQGIATGIAGSIYIADYGNHVIRKIVLH